MKKLRCNNNSLFGEKCYFCDRKLLNLNLFIKTEDYVLDIGISF